jgi:predicted DCC family thiol-disulfide oxidoreductase YuxK
MRRIIFFDGPCPLCNRVIHWIMKADTRRLFLFASLQGETARDLPKDRDSLILLEERPSGRRLTFEAKAVLRILWLLGGRYRLLGWARILPGWLTNPYYRAIARNRYCLFSPDQSRLLDSTRLLP